MINPLLECVETMVACGWHISDVSIVRGYDGRWVGEIGVQDNVPSHWTWQQVGGKDQRRYAITAPPVGPLDGVAGVTVESWINRPHPYILDLPPITDEVAETWVNDVARAGLAPDVAKVAGRRWLCKPIEWLREPLRSALLARIKG